MRFSLCGVVRPIVVVVAMVAMLSIVAPDLFATIWPYLAAAAVLAVPALVWQIWNSRYNPGCSVRYVPYNPDESVDSAAQ